jgi:hypothetical protein
MSILMDLNFLINSEIETINNTSSNIPIAESVIENYINLFFKYQYDMKTDFIPDSDDHYFHSLAYYNYARLPYNIRSVYTIWEKGYYLESIVLLRHIVEGFIQLRYFFKYKDKIKTHFEASRSRDRIQFKTMFDEFAMGFYEIMYGKFYSRFAHSHFVSSIFRANFTPERGELIYGCEYNDQHANLIINQLTTFCYAYLNYIEVFFPKFPELIGDEDYKKYSENLSGIRSQVFQPKATEEFQRDFDKMILPLIEK